MPTLYRIGSELSSPVRQNQILQDLIEHGIPSFDSLVEMDVSGAMSSDSIEILQVNVGKVCNQTCTHCHVDAGPDRRENMSRETAEQILSFFRAHPIPTLDITGGAPEMNPQFRWLVEQAHGLGRSVIDRCNLTILLANGFEWLAPFLADHRVRVIASLPCYLEENCDRQRGAGVFDKSIEAIRRLNSLGYGQNSPDSLELDLIYNPVGWGLPPDQQKLESDYREQLSHRFGISFNRLFTITNMPISRFLDDLVRHDMLVPYMQKLAMAFNPSTLPHLMCRNTLSIDWRGYLYDCDFNQMLNLPVGGAKPLHISQADFHLLQRRPIRTGNHCMGCTAGCGSSCQGAITG